MPSVFCITDSKSLKDILLNTKVIQDKRLLVAVARLREMTDKNEIKVIWLEKEKQLADCMKMIGSSSKNLFEVLKSSSLEWMIGDSTSFN